MCFHWTLTNEHFDRRFLLTFFREHLDILPRCRSMLDLEAVQISAQSNEGFPSYALAKWTPYSASRNRDRRPRYLSATSFLHNSASRAATELGFREDCRVVVYNTSGSAQGSSPSRFRFIHRVVVAYQLLELRPSISSCVSDHWISTPMGNIVKVAKIEQ